MIKVLAVSAPQWIQKPKGINKVQSFNSLVPFSLQNAMRDAAEQATTNKSSYWFHSNYQAWEERNEATILMEHWEDEKDEFSSLFKKINPDILFIGAMTLSLPGAIAIAEKAKEIKGDNVFIVLGGKHVNETLFHGRNGNILNHISSPVSLIIDGKIKPVFDLIISGNAEKIITNIGELVGILKDQSESIQNILNHKFLQRIAQSEGDWIAGYFKDNEPKYLSNKSSFDYSKLAVSSEFFNSGDGFNIFQTDKTYHAYSDMSRGCGYNCFFCSEKSSINGKLGLDDEIYVQRLIKQFNIIKSKRLESTSIFIEDSIFLAGIPRYIELFIAAMQRHNFNIPFGVQFTIDTFLNLSKNTLSKLNQIGLTYIAFGIETNNDAIASQFSKNTNKKSSWIGRIEDILSICKEHHFKCGMFLIWGLGEIQKERIDQLGKIIHWMDIFEVPIDVGLNYATQHPLRIINDTNLDVFGYKSFDFVKWGTPSESPYLEYFVELFGEASIEYIFHTLPGLEELQILKEIYLELKRRTQLLLDTYDK